MVRIFQPTADTGAAIGGVITGGTTGSVLFVGPGSTIAQDNANFFWDDTNNRLSLGTSTNTTARLLVDGGTVTTDLYALHVKQTWNNAAVTFSGAVIDITDTASAGFSKGLDLRVNGASVMEFRKTGEVKFGSLGVFTAGTLFAMNALSDQLLLYSGAGTTSSIALRTAVMVNPTGDIASGLDNLTIAGATQTGSDAASYLATTGTWNTSGTPTAWKLNVMDTASNAAALLQDLQVGSVSMFKVNKAGKISLSATNTAGGTTGNQTINKPSGTVNFAASASTLTVTNSLVTTSSIVLAVIRTNDTTATIKNVVPGSSSFVITLTAAATAETSVGFIVIN